MVDMSEVQLTFSLVNPDILKHKIKKTAIYSEAEAKKDETTPSKEDLNIVLVGKTMDKLSLDMKRVININTTVAGDIITSAEKILKIGTDFDKASGNKSDTLKVFKETVLTAKSFNRYIKTVEKSERTAGSVIIGAYLLATLDIAGIISEAINAISTGKYSSIDEYATSTKAYIAMIDSAKKLNGEEVSKIQSELFKESDDVSLDSLSPLAQKGMLMYSESTTVGLLRLIKGLLFKGLYVILGPIRYVIYLFLYAKYSMAERLNQVKKTISMYDESIPVSEKEVRIEQLEKTANDIKIDRIKTMAKVDEVIEADRKENAKDANELFTV